MYYADLQPYRFGLPVDLPGVLTVGWLAASQAFPKGESSEELLSTMASLLSTHRTNPMRGYHLCEFCPAPEPLQLELPHQTLMLGSGEIWVPSSDSRCIYAAPDLIHHYMAKHHYAPPDEFLAAVANVKNLPEWSATQERARRVRAALIDPRP